MPDVSFDLRYLRYALLAAEHGSFRRVAEVLGVSQSTVSRRIEILERRLGTPLFDRGRMGAKPTPSAERFFREAEAGATRLINAVNDLNMAKRGQVGELRIALMASLAGGFLAELLHTFHLQYPDVDIQIEETTSGAGAAGVSSGRFDAAFVPGEPSVQGCQTELFWDERIYFGIAESHRLANASSISWVDLAGETFLVTADGAGPEIEAYLLRQLSTSGFRPYIAVHQVGRENIFNLAAKGFGITLTTESSIGVVYPGLTFVALEGLNHMVPSSVVWSLGNRNPALPLLLGLARRRR
ncbi:MAG: LysR family transcriptional regulator [Rhizobiaceae bacterium]|nr:LysR family transcriptional regulator [Rhizobiaceae bacterium]